MQDSAVGQCMYRMAQDGLRTILPHVTKQILHPSATEMLRLLKERNVPLPAGQKLHSSLARPHGQVCIFLWKHCRPSITCITLIDC